MLEDVGADVRDDALAEPVHAVEARGTRKGEDEADAHQRGKIDIDQLGLDPAEAEIDHAPNGKRNGEGCGSGEEQGEEGRRQHALVAQQIGPEPQQRT